MWWPGGSHGFTRGITGLCQTAMEEKKNPKLHALRGIPERADDRPAVVASVDLELVGVSEAKDLAVPQPEHVGRIRVLGAGASEIALHGDGFAQR